MVQRRRDGVKPAMPTATERLEMLTAMGGKPYWEWAQSDGGKTSRPTQRDGAKTAVCSGLQGTTFSSQVTCKELQLAV